MTDLWTYLQSADKPIVMYGMGNGADKILDKLAEKGVEVADFFASDGFVRGHSFHGKKVLSFDEIRVKYPDFIILLSFGSSRDDVLSRFFELDDSYEVYAPDVPVCGGEIFDADFYEAHKNELDQVRSLLADEESRIVFDGILKYRLTGSIKPLKEHYMPFETVMNTVLNPDKYKRIVDLGAYVGDTAAEFLKCPHADHIDALEPDPRSYKKLYAFAENEGQGKIFPLQAAAWSEDATLYFSQEGNRNSSLFGNKNGKEVQARSVDSILNGFPCDFIKMDTEGAEWEALEGCRKTLANCAPDLAVSLYHRSADIFRLPLWVHEHCPDAALYIRRPRYIPPWDLCLYAVQGKE